MERLRRLLKGGPHYHLERLPDKLLAELENYIEGRKLREKYSLLAPVLVELDKRWESKFLSWKQNKKQVFRRMATAGCLVHIRYYNYIDAKIVIGLLSTGREDCIAYVYKLGFQAYLSLSPRTEVETYKKWSGKGFHIPTLEQVVNVDNLELFRYLTTDAKTKLGAPFKTAVTTIFQGRKWEFLEYILEATKEIEYIYLPPKQAKYSEYECEQFYQLLRKHYSVGQLNTLLSSADEEIRAPLMRERLRDIEETIPRGSILFDSM